MLTQGQRLNCNEKEGFAMNSIDEFKKRLKDDEYFKKYFKDVKSTEDVIKIAKQKGYDLTKCTRQDEQELREDMLADVAGGSKTPEIIDVKHSTIVLGDNSHAYTRPETEL